MWTKTFYARYRQHADYHNRPAYTEAEAAALRTTLSYFAVSTRHVHLPVVFPYHYETVPGRCLDGLIAACCDGGFDIILVLTRKDADLAKQTLQRLRARSEGSRRCLSNFPSPTPAARPTAVAISFSLESSLFSLL